MKNNSVIFAAGVAVGLFVFWSAGQFSDGSSENSGNAQKNNDPLYWVAPMDPDYRRDGPGKSPMGMDLVPVFQEDSRESHGLQGQDGIDAWWTWGLGGYSCG